MKHRQCRYKKETTVARALPVVSSLESTSLSFSSYDTFIYAILNTNRFETSP
jgi:hypothetical protein